MAIPIPAIRFNDYIPDLSRRTQFQRKMLVITILHKMVSYCNNLRNCRLTPVHCLTNFDMLSGTDITFLTRSGRSHHGHAELTHPYDSIMKIWEIPLFFIEEILVVLIVYSIKLSIKYLRRKLFGIRHRGQRRKY